MKKLNRFLLLLFVLIFIILTFAFNRKTNIGIEAYNGVLNLSNWNFSKNGCAKLQGKWDLYYDELLMPENIKTRKANNYYNVPGKLSDQIYGKTQGYMTLHLKVYVPKDEVYGIYFDSTFSASDIWVNGIYLDGHGKVGKDIKSEKAIYRPKYVFFPSINGEADIVIHASTFRDLEPRLKSATFGTKQQIMKLAYKNVGIDGFTIGIMFIIGILSFGFYFTKPKQKKYIYFAMICFMMILRCLVFNSRLLVQFYPNMNFEVLSKIAAITFYLPVTFYILFLDDMFENRIIIKKPAVVFGIVFTVLCIFTNNMIYDKVGIYAQGITAIFAGYLCVFLGKEIYKNNLNAEKNLFPFIMLCITGLNDALVNNAVLYNSYFVFYGIIVFIIAESTFIINDYLEKHKKLDKINRDGLTSLYNNKYIKELISKQLNHYSQKGEKFSLLMIDIDDFKGINDTFGHMFGDTVIVDVASILYELADGMGYVGRFGGDEFIIMMPKVVEKDAVVFAKKIMNKIEELNDKYNIDRKISLSIGVYENNVDNLEQCINNADNSMYKAKLSSKNCINRVDI